MRIDVLVCVSSDVCVCVQMHGCVQMRVLELNFVCCRVLCVLMCECVASRTVGQIIKIGIVCGSVTLVFWCLSVVQMCSDMWETSFYRSDLFM